MENLHCYAFDTCKEVTINNKRKKPCGDANRTQQLFDIMCCYFKGMNDIVNFKLANFLTNSSQLSTSCYDFIKFMKEMDVCFVIYQIDESKMFLKLIDRIGSQHYFATKIGVLHIPANNGIEEENLLLITKTNETNGVKNYFYDFSKCLTKINFVGTHHIDIVRLPYFQSLDICNVISLYFEYTDNKKHITYPSVKIYSSEFDMFLKQNDIEIYLFNVNIENTQILCSKVIGSCHHTSTKIMIFRTTNNLYGFLSCEYSLIVNGIKGHEILNNKNYPTYHVTTYT